MTDHNTVPAKVVTEDHRLESAANKSGEALANHRWHWTIDESNPERVSFSEYARAVGRHRRVIKGHADGYAQWCDRSQHDDRTLQELIQLQSVKEADREIVSAVAKETGTSIVNTRQHHKEDVQRVRNAVADAREREPEITPEREQEVVQRTAKFVAAGRKVEKTKREQRRKSTPLQVLVVEGDLQRARDALTKALDDAGALDLDGVEEELISGLRDAINAIVALGRQIQAALGVDMDDVDWDAELSKLSGGGH